MSAGNGTCPLSTREIVDEYFIENRTKLLDVAAFLDRLERASGGEVQGRDFRVRVFQDALALLCDGKPSRVIRLQMLLSDPTTEPRETLDQKSAKGAYDDCEAPL